MIWKTIRHGRAYRFLFPLFLLVSFTAALGQQHEHGSHDMSSEKLGNVSFPTSCSSKVQSEFETGVASLHSFEYDKAMRHFNDVLEHDPNCAIAHWGEAMALYHQLWNIPSGKDLAEGWQFVQKAQAESEQSPREREYIQAMAVFYKPGKQSAEDRATAYSQAMGKLHEDCPSDEEATVFYALSLLAAEPPSDTSLQYAKKAVGLLNGVLATDPEHPGVAHYLIHACDNPVMAQEGLGAAKRYAMIAPSSPHALHMPSHIFARLGLWQEDISSNLAAVASALHGPSGTEARLHPMDFLEYAYLQMGQDDKGRAIEAQALALKNEGFTRGLEPYYFYVQAHFPALLALETKDWKAAESLQPIAGANPRVRAITYWAQAVGAGRLGDVAAVRVAVHNLDEALEADKKSHPDSPAPPVDTNKNEAHAWLAFAEKDSAAAFELIKPVIQFQDEVGKGEVELPAREMYADMLLELNRPKEALEQYRLSLKSDPNRFNGLYGAGRSAELANQKTLAGTYYKRLLDNCDLSTESDRPELQHAKRFVAETAIQ
jgi:tetratricopeptide (TPR) repeat protein